MIAHVFRVEGGLPEGRVAETTYRCTEDQYRDEVLRHWIEEFTIEQFALGYPGVFVSESGWAVEHFPRAVDTEPQT